MGVTPGPSQERHPPDERPEEVPEDLDEAGGVHHVERLQVLLVPGERTEGALGRGSGRSPTTARVPGLRPQQGQRESVEPGQTGSLSGVRAPCRPPRARLPDEACPAGAPLRVPGRSRSQNQSCTDPGPGVSRTLPAQDDSRTRRQPVCHTRRGGQRGGPRGSVGPWMPPGASPPTSRPCLPFPCSVPPGIFSQSHPASSWGRTEGAEGCPQVGESSSFHPQEPPSPPGIVEAGCKHSVINMKHHQFTISHIKCTGSEPWRPSRPGTPVCLGHFVYWHICAKVATARGFPALCLVTSCW